MDPSCCDNSNKFNSSVPILDDEIFEEMECIERVANGGSIYKVALNCNTTLEPIRHKLKTLTRTQLEDVVMKKVCSVINSSYQIMELKKQLAEQYKKFEQAKQVQDSLRNQIDYLMTVEQQMIASLKKSHLSGVPPKLTRSVKLQTMPDPQMARFIGSRTENAGHSIDLTFDN